MFSGWKCKLDARHDESLFIHDFETQSARSIGAPPLPPASVFFVSPEGKVSKGRYQISSNVIYLNI